jgi:hypothetical protein
MLRMRCYAAKDTQRLHRTQQDRQAGCGGQKSWAQGTRSHKQAPIHSKLRFDSYWHWVSA